jgi:hypothetical protein
MPFLRAKAGGFLDDVGDAKRPCRTASCHAAMGQPCTVAQFRYITDIMKTLISTKNSLPSCDEGNQTPPPAPSNTSKDAQGATGPLIGQQQVSPDNSRTMSVDFHPSSYRGDGWVPYHERESVWYSQVERGLKIAQAEGYGWVEFTHGCSTSGPFKKTARSVVRGFMRSPAATPYIIRQDCVQCESRYVARIRPLANPQPSGNQL